MNITLTLVLTTQPYSLTSFHAGMKKHTLTQYSETTFLKWFQFCIIIFIFKSCYKLHNQKALINLITTLTKNVQCTKCTRNLLTYSKFLFTWFLKTIPTFAKLDLLFFDLN